MNKYILEIKNRFILITFNWIFLFFVSYFYKETIMFVIIKPCYCIADGSLLLFNSFIFTGVTELFLVYVLVSKFITNQVCFIFVVFNFLSFLAPALYSTEYIVFLYLFVQIFIVLTISYYFFYKILLPMLLVFFLGFHNTNSGNFSGVSENSFLHFEARVSEYIDFYISTYYSCVLNLQLLFFLIIILFYFNLTNFLGIRHFRKISYVLFLFIATLITPPDVTSQLITFVFLLSLFEIALFINCIKNSITLLIR